MPRGSREGIARAQRHRWPHWRERFEAHVDRSPGFGPDGDCHRWTGATTGYPGNRYGTITVEGRPRRAHRVAWEIAHGKPFPAGRLALHSCDVGVCVNAAHIRPGTQSENMREAFARGRKLPTVVPPEAHARGEAHSLSRLTARQVRSIRTAHASGAGVALLARRYAVGWSTIDKIVKRQTWRHVE